MGKRKLDDDETKPIDLVSSVHEVYEDYPISKHRTCWVHVLASLHARKKKITKEKLRCIRLTAPCFSETFPHRERSERRVKCKYAISKLKKRLDSEAFSCYMENLWRSFSDDKKTSFTYMDCLWFSLYRNATHRTKVLSWIKGKHIFQKKYVFVPIVCWSHWNLLIFCNFGESFQSKTTTPCMLLLDSLQMANPRRLEPDIRKFVFDIYKVEGRPENKKMISQIPLLVPKVPQQRNGEECGSCVLYFISLFMEHAPENFSIEDYPYFMVKDWFRPEGLERFCQKLDSLSK